QGIDTLSRTGTEPAEENRIGDKYPEEHLEPRTINRRTYLRCIKPWQHKQDSNRTKHHQNAAELGVDRADIEGNRTQHRIERQEVPFRDDMRRGYHRICFNIVIRMAKIVRH